MTEDAIAIALGQGYDSKDPLFAGVVLVTDLSLQFMICWNFLFYFATSRDFRSTVFGMFPCTRRRITPCSQEGTNRSPVRDAGTEDTAL